MLSLFYISQDVLPSTYGGMLLAQLCALGCTDELSRPSRRDALVGIYDGTLVVHLDLQGSTDACTLISPGSELGCTLLFPQDAPGSIDDCAFSHTAYIDL